MSDETTPGLESAENRLREAWVGRELAPERLRRVVDEVRGSNPEEAAGAGLLAGLVALGDAHGLAATGGHAEAVAQAERARGIFLAGGEAALAAWAELTHGTAAFYSSRHPEAMERAQRARDEFRKIGDVWGEAASASAMSNVARVSGRPREGLSGAREALRLFEVCGHEPGRAAVLNNLGAIAHGLGDYGQAAGYFEQALRLARAIGYRRIETYALNNIGTACEGNGDLEAALGWHRESLALKQAGGDRRGQGISLNNIGLVLKKLGRGAEAEEHQGRALAIFTALGDKWGQSYCQQEYGDLAKERGDLAAAREHFGEAVRLRHEVGDRILEGEAMCLLGEVVLMSRELPERIGEARRLAEAGLAIGVEHQALPLQIMARKLLHLAEREGGDLARALEHCEQTLELERQLARREADLKFQNMRVLHEVEVAQRGLAEEQGRSRELGAALAEAERQRQRAVAADAYKSEILRIVAHDLRNPVAAIRSLTDLLTTLLPEGGEEAEYATLIANSADNVLALVGNLLDASALEEGRLDPARERVNVSGLLVRLVEELAAQARAKQQVVELAVEPDLWVEGDVRLLATVFANLLTNALKYSQPGRRVWVRAEARVAPGGEPEVAVAVRDEGAGLSAGDLERMFGQFTRLSAKPTAGEASTGLGLYIVRRLVDLHGGRVWAESEGTGRGSVFWVVLPAVG